MERHLSRGDELEMLIYVSTVASHALDDAQLDALVMDAAANNRRLGITGLLVCDPGHFMQLLEGPSRSVRQLWERIRHDSRHLNVRQIARDRIDSRMCHGWSMRCYRMAPGNRRAASDILDRKARVPLSKVTSPAVARSLLEAAASALRQHG